VPHNVNKINGALAPEGKPHGLHHFRICSSIGFHQPALTRAGLVEGHLHLRLWPAPDSGSGRPESGMSVLPAIHLLPGASCLAFETWESIMSGLAVTRQPSRSASHRSTKMPVIQSARAPNVFQFGGGKRRICSCSSALADQQKAVTSGLAVIQALPQDTASPRWNPSSPEPGAELARGWWRMNY
jgi:hypothetical protein